MKGKTLLLLAAVFLLTAVGGAGALYYLSTQKGQLPNEPATSIELSPAPTSQPTLEPEPTEPVAEGNVPSDWLTYTSEEYGFQISFPADYEPLDDTGNLYGWPNGVVLLYRGGQAYDIVIEAWNNEADYLAKYGSRIGDLTAFEIGGRFITILDNTQNVGNAAVIETFLTL
jgi:hypothetical protein